MENRHSSLAGDGEAGSFAAIRGEFLRNRDPDRILAWRSALVDRTVIAAGQLLLRARAPAGFAILAVGGYGRRQLFPFSDVDLLLLFEHEADAAKSRTLLSPFLQNLWDAGLRVSHSVRTLEECTTLQERNVELNISLLDQRYLAGDATLAGRLAERLPRFVHGNRRQLVRNLSRLTAERHQKFGNTIYHLEPNVKEAPGGLRDFQVASWTSQILAADGRRLPASSGIPAVEPARRLLATVRCLLHYHNARDANLLTFDAQEGAAEADGHGDPATWMREYYRAARGIYRTAANLLDAAEAQPGASLFSQLVDWHARLSNSEFSVLRDRVYLRSPNLLERDPGVVLRLFSFVARHGFQLSQDTRWRLQAQTAALEVYYRGPGPFYAPLAGILKLRHAVKALREMHETGVLFCLLPELEQIDCLVIRDFYHRYTVDEHSLVAIQTLLDLESATDVKAQAFREVLAECERRDLLVFALLFHDAGKGRAGAGHVEGSLWIAECAMERLQMPAADRDLVRFLIHRHLELSRTMQSRDLSEAATIRAVAERVGTVERLRALTVLTYCDISAVNPNAMTPWRAAELFRLHRLTYHELTRELETDRIAEPEAMAPELDSFLSGFPRRYLLTHGKEEIQEHFGLAQRVPTHGVAVSLRSRQGAHQLVVLAKDRPALFANLAGTLAGFGMNIIKAEAFSNRRGEVLDTFLFADPNRTLELNPSESERLVALMERAALGKVEVKQLLKTRPPVTAPSRGATVEPRVSFDDEASPSSTLIQVLAQDRPGLLYDLASVLSAAGCNIEVVLIDTEAHRAIDVFFATRDGEKLHSSLQAELKPLLESSCRKSARGD